MNELTVMIFFAGDNTLSPSMISQLKAIKDAGFQENTTVMVRYDPNEKGARTRIFEVNKKEKASKKTRIGDGLDPYVRNLEEDEVQLTVPLAVAPIKGRAAAGAAKTEAASEHHRPDSMGAYQALDSFVAECLKKHPANHYMLFLIGHGMIVGTDAFLPDDNPSTAISLYELRKILERFKKEKGTLQLIGMHSCSMSAAEVAYELKGTARYMMASEGISFVGSWPYRQLLKKIFLVIDKVKHPERYPERDGKSGVLDEKCMRMLVKSLYYLCRHNSTDFMFAGFSADLALCNLSEDKVTQLTEPLQELAVALKAVLRAPDAHERERGKELILLAHWRAQSYWQENYVDLYDFCHCLRKSLSNKLQVKTRRQEAIKTACKRVMGVLASKELREDDDTSAFDNLVVYSEQFGPTYQYSHGLSVYFPWSRPIEDEIKHIKKKNGGQDVRKNGRGKIGGKDGTVLERYNSYRFTTELRGDSWLTFLEEYFEITKRDPREKEDTAAGVLRRVLPATGPVNTSTVSSVSAYANTALSKTIPSDSGGTGCGCPSIKNYSIEFTRIKKGGPRDVKRRGRRKG
jgi:hypothetical protein